MADGEMVQGLRALAALPKGPRFDSQNVHSGSQLSFTPVRESDTCTHTDMSIYMEVKFQK